MTSQERREIRIGDVYLMQFNGSGNEQKGLRPGLILQNNVGNTFSPNVIVLPLTSRVKKLGQPTHVYVSADDSGLERDSVVLCENPERMSKERLGAYLTTLSDEYMMKIAEAYVLATSAISFLNIDALMSVWKKAIELNAYGCTAQGG